MSDDYVPTCERCGEECPYCENQMAHDREKADAPVASDPEKG